MLDAAAARWELALDSAQRALDAAAAAPRGVDLGSRRHDLVQERQETAELIARVAAVSGSRPAPWLSPLPVNVGMLGLPPTVRACVFDLDGVLTDSGLLHAWAWGEVLDEFLLRLGEKTGWHFIPFDRDADYHAYFDGRSRSEAVRSFLDSRGIHLPEGGSQDAPQADTAYALARRKGEMVEHGLRRRGVAALIGARRYLQAAGYAGLRRAVVSSSTSTLPMLELAGLAALVAERIDADVIRVEQLRSRPAPDLLLAACRRLDVRPADAVTFVHGAAGVAAGRTAGLEIVGVGENAHGQLLVDFGAERVVASLNALLDPRLAERAKG